MSVLDRTPLTVLVLVTVVVVVAAAAPVVLDHFHLSILLHDDCRWSCCR